MSSTIGGVHATCFTVGSEGENSNRVVETLPLAMVLWWWLAGFGIRGSLGSTKEEAESLCVCVCALPHEYVCSGCRVGEVLGRPEMEVLQKSRFSLGGCLGEVGYLPEWTDPRSCAHVSDFPEAGR